MNGPSPNGVTTGAASAERWHQFFGLFAIAAFIIVFAGFARTFFLRFLFTPGALPVYLYLHGVLFTGWFVLFFVQARLIAAHRVDPHKRLGIFGAGLAALGVSLAVFVAIHAGKRVYQTHSKPFSAEGPPMALDLGACLAFAVFVAAALYLRRRSESHKRLMLLGSCSILLPALGRIPYAFAVGGLWGLVGFSEIMPVACILYDTVRHRRLHPAFAWGGLGIILSWPTFLIVGSSNAWLRIATWLVR